jgi:RNA polymerase sigma-70 factor (ECF subfamily)
VASEPVVPAVMSRMDLERAIGRLPEGCRAAFLLHDVEGFDHHEVANILGVSEGTSKSQVHKARMKLRAMLSSQPAGPGVATPPPQRLRSADHQR